MKYLILGSFLDLKTVTLQITNVISYKKSAFRYLKKWEKKLWELFVEICIRLVIIAVKGELYD